MNANIDDALLIRLYGDQTLSVDMLPYTPELDAIVEGYNKRCPRHPLGHLDLYRALIRFRKNGKLITKAKAGAVDGSTFGFLGES